VSVVLVCPLCGADAMAGEVPRAGDCAGCGAAIAGGGASAPEGVAMALGAWGADLPAGDVARALFERDPAPAPAPTAAITSDRREGFYLWWVFVRPGPDGVGETLREFAAGH
jgi:hypothetical protein